MDVGRRGVDGIQILDRDRRACCPAAQVRGTCTHRTRDRRRAQNVDCVTQRVSSVMALVDRSDLQVSSPASTHRDNAACRPHVAMPQGGSPGLAQQVAQSTLLAGRGESKGANHQAAWRPPPTVSGPQGLCRRCGKLSTFPSSFPINPKPNLGVELYQLFCFLLSLVRAQAADPRILHDATACHPTSRELCITVVTVVDPWTSALRAVPLEYREPAC